MVDIFFNISSQTGNLLSRHIPQIFFANRMTYFLKKLPNKIKTVVRRIFKINLDDFRNNGKKENLRRHFGLSSEQNLICL